MSAWAVGNMAEKLKEMKRAPAAATSGKKAVSPAPAPAKEEPAAPPAPAPAAPATPATAPAAAPASKKASAAPTPKPAVPAAPAVKYVTLGPVSFPESLAALASDEFTFVTEAPPPPPPPVVREAAPPVVARPEPPAPLSATPVMPAAAASSSYGAPAMHRGPYQRPHPHHHHQHQHQHQHQVHAQNPPVSYFVPQPQQQQMPRYNNGYGNDMYRNASAGFGDIPRQYHNQRAQEMQQQPQYGGGYQGYGNQYGGQQYHNQPMYNNYNAAPYYGGGGYAPPYMPNRLQSRPPYYPPQEGRQVSPQAGAYDNRQ